MARKAGLGRGLDALFADAAPLEPVEPEEAGSIAEEAAALTRAPGEAEEITPRARRSAGAKGAAAGSGSGAVSADAEGKAGPDAEASGASRGTGRSRSAKAGASAAKAAGGAGTASEDDSDRILYIDINDIKPNSAQPRKNFDEAKLNELASSIRENGVIQPLIVREGSSGYELVAGERRWRASRLAGIRRVPCILRDFDDRQNAIVAIIENMQREDLDPIEEAQGLKSMTETYGFTQEQVSASLGRSRTYIANSIRLLKLPEEIQQYVSKGQMSAAHGRTIINIPDRNKQMEVAEKIIRNDLSVRATEKLAEKIKDDLRPERKKRKKPSKSTETEKSEEIKAVERELMTLTGTKVQINGDESKGRIELEYYSIDELNRLIETLRDAFR